VVVTVSEVLVGKDVPENVRELPVTSDNSLASMEKEVRVVCPKDVQECTISTEIPTFIKWIQSISESTIERVRCTDEGEVVSCKATIPKGVLKFQKSGRKSNQHNQMVTYGSERGEN
jgi:hypothetical protein